MSQPTTVDAMIERLQAVWPEARIEVVDHPLWWIVEAWQQPHGCVDARLVRRTHDTDPV